MSDERLTENLLQPVVDIPPHVDQIILELSSEAGSRAKLQELLEPLVAFDGWPFTLASMTLIAAASLVGFESPKMTTFILQASQITESAIRQTRDHNQEDELVQTLAILHGIAVFWAACERVVQARPVASEPGLDGPH